MSERHVIVTGGSRGIGYAIAERLLREGFVVHITGRDKVGLDKAATSLKKIGRVFAVELDQSDALAIKSFVADWTEPLYGIVNNAGICRTLALPDEGSVDPWEEVIATNLTGPYFLTKGLLSSLQNEGRIVNISSQLGIVGRESYSAYCASKYGINGLTSVWAKELGERGILVNSVLPGWVATEMSVEDVKRMAEQDGVSYDHKMQELSAPLELKRFTEPTEIASVVTFLFSKDGSGVTGQNWLVNGPAS